MSDFPHTNNEQIKHSFGDNDTSSKGLIAWFAHNSIAANLLMLFLIVGGLLTSVTIRQQMFPQVEINWISVNIIYPGAAPQEIEEGIALRVEEALEGVQGLDRVITQSHRGRFEAHLRINRSYDPQETLEEVKSQIDSISSFPDGMERPIIERVKFSQEVLNITLYSQLDNRQLKELGSEIYDEIRALPLVNVSEYFGGLKYEISIEVSKDKLREYGLDFRDIARAVNNFSTNMSAGQIRAIDGYISVRVENQAYTGFEFESIPLINLDDGTQIYLGDVAQVRDGFEEGIQYSKFNGQNSVGFFIGVAENQSSTDVARVVKEYVAGKQTELPEGVSLKVWTDMTYYLEGRLQMMLDNMAYGGLLVFLMLALFLRIRLAFWVMMGLPICFLGTLLLLPLEWVDVTINVVSLFGFILVLGIVVDDAIVIGESAYTEIEEKGQGVETVIHGVKRVAMPATFGVLTTVAAFAPMIMSDGPESAFAHSIGFVVIFCLLFSLVESKLILPAHLAHMKVRPVNPDSRAHRIRSSIDRRLKYFIDHIYRSGLQTALHHRYTVLTAFSAILLISVGLYQGGIVRFIGMPKIPHDYPAISLEMNASSSEQATLDATLKVQEVLKQVDTDLTKKYGYGMIADMQVELRSRTQARIVAKLIEPEQRLLNTFELSALWRKAMPDIPGMKSFAIRDNLFGGAREDSDISFRLTGGSEKQLRKAATELKQELNKLKGVGDVNDSRQDLAREVRFTLKPLAYSMGLTTSEVASQLGFSLFGLEAQRILRDGEEVKVMLRYPKHQRNSIGQIEDVLIQTEAGAEVPLIEIADIHLVESANQIRRENGERSINVWASVDKSVAEPFKITEAITKSFLKELPLRYPGMTGKVAGSIREEMDSRSVQLRNFFLSLILIYGLLAIPLRSWSQPLLIMSVIPFGIIGAMFGHLMLGLDLSALSLFGIIAASGVVINDSLVMMDFVNKARSGGAVTVDMAVSAGCKRFRAIMLTSVTTFIGLVPIMMETSLQAQIVIPMAVSLAFGVLFATVITLLLIPCLFVIVDDFHQIRQRGSKRLLARLST